MYLHFDIKTLITYAILSLGLYNPQQSLRNAIQVNMIRAKEIYGPKDVIVFKVVNNSNKDVFVMTGNQVWREKWYDGVEDIVTDPRQKHQLMFKILAKKSKIVSAFDISKVNADEQAWAQKVKSSSKDSARLHHANSVLNHKPVLRRNRLMLRFGNTPEKLDGRLYGQAYNVLY